MPTHSNTDSANSKPKVALANTGQSANIAIVLVTKTRMTQANTRFANTTANRPVTHQGWNALRTGTGGRAGRVQTEVLVALSNTVASNANSGGIYFANT